jgi:hypothetical protein
MSPEPPVGGAGGGHVAHAVERPRVFRANNWTYRDSSNNIGFMYPCQLAWQVGKFAQLQ